MKSFFRWAASLIVACSFIFLFVPNFIQGTGDARAAEDNRAADFVLKDLAGKNIKLSDYRGRVVLLYFMATWCRDCRAAIPDLKGIYSTHNAKGLVLLNIGVRESRNKLSAFSNKNELPYQTLVDEDGKVSDNYGIMGVPVKVLIDREGRIICWNCRSLDTILKRQLEKDTRPGSK